MADDQKAGELHAPTARPGVPASDADEGAPSAARTDLPAKAKPAKVSKIKPRKFYLLGTMPHARAAGRKLLNGAELDGTGLILAPSMFKRGFRDYASAHDTGLANG